MRVGFGCDRIQHPLGKDQPVVLVRRTRVEGIALGVSSNGVRLGDACSSRGDQGLFQLGEGVVPQDLMVELFSTLNVKGEPTDLADG